MKSALLLRAAPTDVSKLMGSWGWAATGGQQYILKIIATDIKAGYDNKLWCIKDDVGNILATVNDSLLCEWLELDMLMALNPLISSRAASVALTSQQLDEFLSPKGCGRILIEEKSCAEVQGDFINIEVSLGHDESQLYVKRKCLHLGLSSQILFQHVHLKTIRKLPEKFDSKSDRVKWVDSDVCVEVGNVCLPIQQIALLERGSLLLLSGIYAEFSILRLKTNLIEVDIQENTELAKWMVIEVRRLEMAPVDQQEFLSSEDQVLANNSMYIGDIPVNIKVQLVQAKVKFMDLMQLEVGTFIALETPDELKVDIICNDIPIAQGYLVELDGKLAVEVQSIRPMP
jgi:flagellar motor switch/type III secretory pathway protein FliN